MSEENKSFIEALKREELLIDKKMKELKLWQRSFQTNICNSFLLVEQSDYSNSPDKSYNFISRLSALYDIIEKRSRKEKLTDTTTALMTTAGDISYLKELNQLYAYGHFCMLMPQLHRDIFKVELKANNFYSLRYRSDALEQAETKDKILSTLAQQITIPFSDLQDLRDYTDLKAARKIFDLTNYDEGMLKVLFNHHKQSFRRVLVLEDAYLIESLGFTNKDYKQFSAGLLAMSEFFLELSRSFRRAAESSNDLDEADMLMREYLDWSVCTLDIKILDSLRVLTELDQVVFDRLLCYYILDYEKNTNTAVTESKTLPKDGYFPPLILAGDSVIFSPLALRYMYAFNNILFSVKEKQQRVFDQQISCHLEPTLIRQVEQLFSYFGNIQCASNVNYDGGEVDLLVLDTVSEVCLAFQIKATIAAASTRGVSRVQGRSEEGIRQIKRWQQLGLSKQKKIIENAFNTTLNLNKVGDVLLVRSSAGQESVWESGVSIVNYDFLRGLMGKKLTAGNPSLDNFDVEVSAYMQELITISEVKTQIQLLSVGHLNIEFPDQEFNDNQLIYFNLKMGRALEERESAL